MIPIYYNHTILLLTISGLGLYSFTIFCWWYRQLIIAILTIISVIVDEYSRNIDAIMTWPISNTKEHVRGLAHSSVLEISQVVTALNRKQYYACLCFKSISFPAGNNAIIWASRVASTALIRMHITFLCVYVCMCNKATMWTCLEYEDNKNS